MSQNKLHEIEDPNTPYYEPKPAGEKNFWKQHVIQKHLQPQGNDANFNGSNVNKDQTHQPGDPKADLEKPFPKGDEPSEWNSKTKSYKVGKEKGVSEETMTSAEKTKREKIVKGLKKQVSGFKDRYGDRWKDVMYATATKQAMKEEYEELDEDNSAATSDNPGMGGGSTAGLGSSVDTSGNLQNGLPSPQKTPKNAAKAMMEKIAMQAAELYDEMEDEENSAWASSAISEIKNALDDVYDHIKHGDKDKGSPMTDNAPSKKMNKESITGDTMYSEEADLLENKDDEVAMAKNQLATASRAIKNLMSKLGNKTQLPAWVQSKITTASDHLDTVSDYMSGNQVKEELKGNQNKIDKNHNGKLDAQDFKLLRKEKMKEEFNSIEELEEATVKNSSGTIIGTHKPGEGFKPNAEGTRLGHKPHPTDAPKGSTISKRGRPHGSKSSGASKRRDMTQDEAGGPSEKPSFTDQLLNAHGHRDGGKVTFSNGTTHHITKTHAAHALSHFAKPQYAKPADKERLRKHMSSSHENFMHAMKTGEAPSPNKYDPDAKIKSRTAQITSGNARTDKNKAMAQKILAMRKAKK